MEITWESVAKVWVVRLGGRLDVSKSEELEKQLVRAKSEAATSTPGPSEAADRQS